MYKAHTTDRMRSGMRTDATPPVLPRVPLPPPPAPLALLLGVVVRGQGEPSQVCGAFFAARISAR